MKAWKLGLAGCLVVGVLVGVAPALTVDRGPKPLSIDDPQLTPILVTPTPPPTTPPTTTSTGIAPTPESTRLMSPVSTDPAVPDDGTTPDSGHRREPQSSSPAPSPPTGGNEPSGAPVEDLCYARAGSRLARVPCAGLDEPFGPDAPARRCWVRVQAPTIVWTLVEVDCDKVGNVRFRDARPLTPSATGAPKPTSSGPASSEPTLRPKAPMPSPTRSRTPTHRDATSSPATTISPNPEQQE